MRKFLVPLIAAAIGFSAALVISQDKSATPSADPQQQMADWMKLNSPGPQHELLKKMAGTFDAESSMMMGPNAPAQTSKGKEVTEMILDGRYLQIDFTGDFMGSPFHGMGVTGYDQVKKKYVMGWIDSMSTGIMTMEGDADASGKTITFTGEAPCPMSNGKPVPMKQIMKIVDDDHHELEMFGPGPDGKEMQSMTIKYTRAK